MANRPKRYRIAAAAALAALFLAVIPAGATTLISLSLADLVENADVIVEARVVSVTGVRPRPGGIICTDAVLEVTAVHKGAARRKMTVRALGGIAGGLGCGIAGAARFRPDETVLVFLDEKAGSLRSVGMGQGKFSIRRGAGGLVAERDLGGAMLVARRAGRLERAAGGPKAPGATGGNVLGTVVPLERLRSEILRLAAAERKVAREEVLPPRARDGAAPLSPEDLVLGAAQSTAIPPIETPGGGAAGPAAIAQPEIGLIERAKPVLPKIGAVLGLLAAASALVLAVALRRERRSSGRAKGIILLVVLSAGLLAGSAYGWQRMEVSPFGSGIYLKWNAVDIPTDWSLDTDTVNRLSGFGISQTNARDELGAAFYKWEAVDTAYITFPSPNPADDSASPHELTMDDTNHIFWATEAEETYLAGGALAICADWYIPVSGRITEADIVFNLDYDWKLTGNLDTEVPIDSVALHEMGHWCGLDHSGSPDATMFYSWHSGSETLDQDDKDGLTAIYPDMTAPAAPVITVPASDPNAQPDDPVVDIQGTCTADTVTIRVNGSTDGVTHVPNSGVWTYAETLTAPGNYDYSVRAYDARDNESGADTVQIQYTTTSDPYVSAFTMADATSALTTVTNAFVVDASVTAADPDGTVDWYLLKEDATPPDATEMTTDGTAAAPTSFDFAAAVNGPQQGDRTVYCWVMDDANNISQGVSVTITVDTLPPVVAPDATPISITEVLVRFNEDVQNGNLAGSYSIAGAGTPSVTGATAFDGALDAYVLTVSGLVATNSYDITVASAVTDITTENAVAAPYDVASFTAAGDSTPPTVQDRARDVNHTTTDVIFDEPVDRTTAETLGNYRVLADSFSGTAAYIPDAATLIGPNVVRLNHFNTHDAEGMGYVIDYVLSVRNVQDLAGNAMVTRTDVSLSVEDAPSLFYSQWDNILPTVDSFEVRDPDNGDTTDTWFPTVDVVMTESDPQPGSPPRGGEVVRWWLSESSATPTAAQMWASGLPERPVTFRLSEGSGARTVYAWVMDSHDNVSAQASAGITLLANGGPTAVANASETTVADGIPVDFDSASSTPPADGRIVSWHWDYDDAGATSTQADPTYTFSGPGVYNVDLTVTDDRGGTDTDTIVITVISDTTDPVLDADVVNIAGRVDDAAVVNVYLYVTETAANSGGLVVAADGTYSGDVGLQVGANSIEIRNTADDAVLGTISVTRSEP